MTSRISFAAATSSVFASLLVLSTACSDVIDVPPTDDGTGGDDGGGDGGDGGGDTNGPNEGECPSKVLVQNICQPDVPVLSVQGDCDFGIQDGQCKPAAPEAGTLADCENGISDGLCDVAAPLFTNWTCNYGGALPGLHAANGSALGVEGVSPFTACRAAWADNCAANSMPKFGVATCQPVSARACPTDWPTPAELGAGGTILYVRDDVVTAGDGLTPQTPTTLPAALAAATEGDVIALRSGTYTIDRIELQQRTSIVGACASGTRISPATPSEAATLIAMAGDGVARLSNVTLALNGDRPAVTVGAGTTQMDNVQILDARGNGVTAQAAANLTLNSVLIKDTATNAAGQAGTGLAVIAASTATLNAVSLVGNHGAGITVDGANSNVIGTDVLVLDTLAASAGGPGQGAAVGTGANLDLTRAAIARNRDAGIFASGAGSSVFLLDAYITETAPVGAGNLSGAALYGSDGVAVVAERLMAENNALGLRIAGAESTLDVTDGIIADPTAAGANPAANAGAGLLGESGPGITAKRLTLLRNRRGVVSSGGSLQLDSAVIAGSTGLGLEATAGEVELIQVTLADNAGGVRMSGNGTIDVTDARIVDTRQGTADTHALYIDTASGNLDRVLLARNAEYGVFISGLRPDLNFTDLRITDTRSVQSAGKAVHGIGLVVTDPAGAPNIGVTRARIEDSHDYGVLVDGPGPQVFLTDVRVLGTQPAGARSGGVLFINSAPADQAAGGLVELERVEVDDNSDSGVSVSGPGIELDLTDVTISNTSALASGEAGAGLSAEGGAILSGTRVILSNNARAGVVVEGAGTALDLTDLIVNDTQPAGASGPSGEGLKVIGGSAEITNASLLRNAAAGIWAAQGGNVTLNDVVLEETQAPAGGSGIGIDVIGATLTGDRVTLNKNHGLGLSASLGALITLTDVDISQTSAAAIGGRGAEVSSGSNVTLNRTRISGSPDYAVLVAGPDGQTPALQAQFPGGSALPAQTTLNLYDLSVHDVGGGGVAILPGSTVELDTFDIRTSGVVGLQLVSGSTVKASGGKISSNPVGVNVQGGTVDLATVLENTVVSSNQVDKGTQELPVPALSDVASRSSGRLDAQAVPSPR